MYMLHKQFHKYLKACTFFFFKQNNTFSNHLFTDNDFRTKHVPPPHPNKTKTSAVSKM